jgi:hypothetical protein
VRNYVFVVIFSHHLSVNAESLLPERNEAIRWSHEQFSFALSVSFHHFIILAHLSHALESEQLTVSLNNTYNRLIFKDWEYVVFLKF